MARLGLVNFEYGGIQQKSPTPASISCTSSTV
jgi:hypothetical protein